jgi:hypothetical protein
MRSDSQVRCSGLSQCACSGWSVSQNSTTKPSITAGTASTMNSHCQPARPRAPSIFRMTPDTSDPSTTEIGIAVMKSPMIRER